MNKRDIIICGGSALAASTISLLLYRYFSQRSKNCYETAKLVNEYLMFHYGKPKEVLSYSYGPMDALDFPLRCADVCIRYAEANAPSNALDVGCAVGRSTFELAKTFKSVVGIDFSQAFIKTCVKLKTYGKLHYQVTTEGSLYSEHDAVVDDKIDRSRVSFQWGDACNLPADLGQFGCILAANLICRLPNPYKFLDRLPSLVAPGGIVVLTCPFTWMEDFTPKSLWLGGYKDADGNNISSFDALQKYMKPNFELLEVKDMQFFIRETARKNQWSVALMSVWKRRKLM